MLRRPSGFSISMMSPGAEILDRENGAERLARRAHASKADQIGVIIFALLERGQIAARNRQKLAAQRLGAGAVADLLEPGDRHGAGAFHRLQRQGAIADLDHFVAAHAFGALRKQLQPDLAANAVGTGNGSEGDPVVAGSAGRTCPWQLRLRHV
jgi:hypothetical protein